METNKEKVALVILTFNRPGILKMCLESVYSQTRIPEEIIVIDNSPTDHTQEMVKKYFPKVVYKHFKENIGSAGGYYEGIKLAAQRNDYIWILDDDFAAEKNAVDELVKWARILEKETKIGAVRILPYSTKNKEPVEVISFPWRGTMLKSEVVRNVGLPERKFFLYAEDIEYALRIKKAGYKMYAIFSSQIREISSPTKYKVKLLGTELQYYPDTFRLYYAYRNELYMHIKHENFVRIIRLLFYALRVVILFLFQLKTKKVVAIMEGLYHGFLKRLGKNENYLPV